MWLTFKQKLSFSHLLILALFTFMVKVGEVNAAPIFGRSNLVKFSGKTNFTASYRNQSSSFEENTLPNSSINNRYEDRQSLNNSSQLFIKTKTIKKNPINGSRIKYGSTIKLESEASSDQNRARFDIDQVSVFAKSSFGKFEFGNHKAVNQKMKAGPASFAKGNGGIKGNYLKYVNFPKLTGATNSNIKMPNFILIPQSPIGHGGYAQGYEQGHYQLNNGNFNKDRLKILRNGSFNGAQNALKLSYYTPRVSGVKAGISYSANSSDRGLSTTVFNDNSTQVSNVVSLGINYTNEIDNFGYAFSATAEQGKFKNSSINANDGGVNRRDLSSYDIATTLTYFGFVVGASYGSWGNSLQQKNGANSCDYDSNIAISSQDCSSGGKNFDKASYYTLGLAYQFGPFSTSVTSLKSTFQENDYQAVSLDIDYKLTKDLMPYIEITQFEFKSNQPEGSDIANSKISNNKGMVGLAGFVLSF